MLNGTAKWLLVTECALLSALATVLISLMLSRSYTFHFETVAFNYYTNGSSDFTTNVTVLVRSLLTIAVFSLFFGVSTGAAIGFTCSTQIKATKPASSVSGYDEEMAKMGFVVINKTSEGATYKLTDLGRRFLRDYRFLEKTEEVTA